MSAQPAIFKQDSPHHHVLEFRLDSKYDSSALTESLRTRLLADLRKLRLATKTDALLIAFSPRVWELVSGKTLPLQIAMKEFGELPRRSVVSGGDVFLWLHGQSLSEILDIALAASVQLSDYCELILEQTGFSYHGNRDLTGFEDGTENPQGEAALEAALIADPYPELAGSSIVLSQRWRHDLRSFNSLSISQQEQVIGRTKADSVELRGDEMPADSHVSRVDVKLEGVAQKILRRSFPYGDTREHGLFFLAFSCDPVRFDLQLQRMFGASGDGLHDRLTDFSEATSGNYWFAPSALLLAEALSE